MSKEQENRESGEKNIGYQESRIIQCPKSENTEFRNSIYIGYHKSRIIQCPKRENTEFVSSVKFQ